MKWERVAQTYRWKPRWGAIGLLAACLTVVAAVAVVAAPAAIRSAGATATTTTVTPITTPSGPTTTLILKNQGDKPWSISICQNCVKKTNGTYGPGSDPQFLGRWYRCTAYAAPAPDGLTAVGGGFGNLLGGTVKFQCDGTSAVIYNVEVAVQFYSWAYGWIDDPYSDQGHVGGLFNDVTYLSPVSWHDCDPIPPQQGEFRLYVWFETLNSDFPNPAFAQGPARAVFEACKAEFSF